MAFRIGQKVVCVDVGPTPGIETSNTCPTYLQIGGIYTIRKIGEPPYAPWRKIVPVAAWLEEIIRDGGPEYPDWPFRITRFRPLIERKTDTGMAILRKLLDGNKIEEKV